MNTRQCTYMLTIAESGYLAHAAEKLNISQAALSKFLDEQERLSGMPLFKRQKKRLYPTAAGKIYLETASQFLQVKHYTMQAISALQSQRPILRVVSTPYRGAEMFSRVYTHFTKRFPNVELTLSEAFSVKQEELVQNGQVDFACGANYLDRFPDVVNLPITREEVVIAVPRFHPLAKYASPVADRLVSMPMRAFVNTPFVLPSRKSNIRLLADRLFDQAGIHPVIAFESDNNMAVDAMLRQGCGVGFVSRRYVRMDAELVFYRLDPPCYEITCIRYSKDKQFSNYERYLCALIIQERSAILGNELLNSARVHYFLDALSEEENTEVLG